MMSGQISRLCFLVTLLGCCSPMIAIGQAEKPSQTNPTDVALLEGLQQRVRTAAKKVIPSVVAIAQASKPRSLKHHQPFASGVIITPDGLILSQYHVSHLLDPNDFNKSSKPGERVKVIHWQKSRQMRLNGWTRMMDRSPCDFSLSHKLSLRTRRLKSWHKYATQVEGPSRCYRLW